MNNGTETLTFFTLTDLVGELKRRNFGAVRCETIIRDSGGGQAGPQRRYMLALTAHDQEAGEVLACTLIVGECWATFASHEPWHNENLVTAQQIAVAHLIDRGLTVLPGVYHHEQDGRATCNLWRFDRESKRLIAVAPADPPKTSVLYAGVQGEDIHLFLRITHTLDDAGKLPDVLRAAIAAWLKTPEGAAVNKPIDGDFNWGDYAEWREEIPLPDGIVSVEIVTDEILIVDHDELLTEEDD